MKTIQFNDTTEKAELGDMVELSGQTQEVVRCEESGVLMLNIDANELHTGDLTFIKKLGLTISNPETDRPVALGVDHEDDTFGAALAGFLGAALADDDDDSDFFGGSGFGGSFGGFSGGFGGFGGGSFSGGGASGSF